MTSGGESYRTPLERSLLKEVRELKAERDGLWNACSTCERAITLLVEAEQPTSTDWVNLRAARHLARAALEPKP